MGMLHGSSWPNQPSADGFVGKFLFPIPVPRNAGVFLLVRLSAAPCGWRRPDG